MVIPYASDIRQQNATIQWKQNKTFRSHVFRVKEKSEEGGRERERQRERGRERGREKEREYSFTRSPNACTFHLCDTN